MFSSKMWLIVALVALISISMAKSEVEGLIVRQDIGSIASGILPQSITTTTASSDSTSSSSASTSSPTSSSSSINTTSSDTSTSSSSSSSTSISSTSSSSSSSSNTPTPSVTSTPRSTVMVTITSGGSVFTSSSTDFSQSTVTPTGSANSSGDTSSGSGGIDTATKNKIIGATVGVGGALILACLAFVAYRIWGKKKDHADEDEILMAGSSAHGEKLSHGSSNNPFKSNLEQYHAHSGTNF